MAYFLKQDDNNNQNNNMTQNQNFGGNVYSTSGGEISSQLDNNSNSNNSSNSNSSNSSGNWVNLNSYLDANQNKAGRYANNLYDSNLKSTDENKLGNYKSTIQTAQEQYNESVNNDPGASYNSNKKQVDKSVENALKNWDSVSQDDKDNMLRIQKGYTSDDYIQNTGDKYGYNQIKDDSDYWTKQSGNITNDNYIRSLMGNNVSTGGKNLNSFILGATDDSKDFFKQKSDDYSNWADMKNILENETAKVRDDAVNRATTNSQTFKNTMNSKAAEIKKMLQEAYDTEYGAYQDKLNRQKNNPLVYADNFSNVAGTLGELSHNFKAPSDTIIYDTFTDKSTEAKDQLTRELKGIDSRLQALQGLVVDPTDKSLDSEFEFYTQTAPTEAEIEKQLNDKNYISNLMIENFGDLRNVEFTDPKAVQSLYEARRLGWIDDNTFINMMRPYIKSTYTPLPSAGKQVWEGIRSGVETVATAPVKWTRNAFRKIF